VNFSIIIPTYQRKDLVVSTVRALARQAYQGTFETIVAVDGSTDGTAQAVRAMGVPFPLTVVEQSNQGSASARNRGVEVARGDILLFLDDDMEADPHLLAEHVRSLNAGAEVVTGHVPLHPESPVNFLSASVKVWAEDRAKSLSSRPDDVDFRDVLSGQLSLSRRLFDQTQGFDRNFNRDGTFGNPDRDLACRLLDAGHKIAFNANAISWQTYTVTPREFLRRYRQAGAADVHLAQKNPGRSDQIFDPYCLESRMDRLVWRWLREPIRSMALRFVEAPQPEQWQIDLFWHAWKLEYLQGVREGKRTWRGVRVSRGRP
jgi:glycosyltransferase involved in cell wall biosynthesis